jgi:hypothetical protein
MNNNDSKALWKQLKQRYNELSTTKTEVKADFFEATGKKANTLFYIFSRDTVTFHHYTILKRIIDKYYDFEINGIIKELETV